MTSDAVSVLQALFSSVWSLFTSWYIPGTKVTPAALLFMFPVTWIFVKVVKMLHGNSGGD